MSANISSSERSFVTYPRVHSMARDFVDLVRGQYPASVFGNLQQAHLCISLPDDVSEEKYPIIVWFRGGGGFSTGKIPSAVSRSFRVDVYTSEGKTGLADRIARDVMKILDNFDEVSGIARLVSQTEVMENKESFLNRPAFFFNKTVLVLPAEEQVTHPEG